jgi:hypothetical protein
MLLQSQNHSKSYVTIDGHSTSLSWCQATIRTRDQLFLPIEIFFRQLRVCYFVAPSLTIGWVCNILLLQGIASIVPLGLSPAGLKTIFYCPNF